MQLFRVVFLAVVFGFAVSTVSLAAGAETRDLILVAGQSNAVGFDAYPSELPAEAADQEVMFWFRTGDPPPDDHDTRSAGKWTTLGVQPRGNPHPRESSDGQPSLPRQYGNFKDAAGGFGPEIGLARELRTAESRSLAIVKVAFSGTGLRTDWNPSDPGDGGACYRALVDEIKAAIARAKDQEIDLRPRALVWVQGESDSNPQDARNYGHALTKMLDSLRKDIDAPQLIALLGVNTRFGNGNNPHVATVVEAQKGVARLDSRCAYVDTVGAETLPPSHTHFTAAGTLEIGRRFAKSLLETEASLATGDSSQRAASQHGGRPNFVVIFADDLGYADLGCYGSSDIRTPRLDAMAARGMKFTSFYAQPICGPSRAALMTGCYPMRVAERGNTKQVHPILHEREITIAELLKTAGYATACFGKWDLAKHAQSGFFPDLLPTHQGFDYFFGTPTSNDSRVNLYRNEELIEPNAEMSTLTRRYTDEAIAFMQENKSKPFFVYLPHTMPHTRLAASESFQGKSKRGLYGDVVEEMDFHVGRMLDAIEEMELANNTYVLFTSDNGPWLIKNRGHADGHLAGDHGGSAGPLRSGKVSTFEGGVRVPAILWGPSRVPPGTNCDQVASTMDVLPTFAALAGVAPPSDRVIDGKDIRHLFRGNFDEGDVDGAFFYYLRLHLQAVRQGRWKLHLPRDKEPPGAAPFSVNTHIAPQDRIGFDQPFLVDLETDLGETVNVADQHPDVVKRLLLLAEAMREDLGDYNRVGKNMRFFDPMPQRPSVPPVPPAKPPAPRKRSRQTLNQ